MLVLDVAETRNALPFPSLIEALERMFRNDATAQKSHAPSSIERDRLRLGAFGGGENVITQIA